MPLGLRSCLPGVPIAAFALQATDQPPTFFWPCTKTLLRAPGIATMALCSSQARPASLTDKGHSTRPALSLPSRMLDSSCALLPSQAYNIISTPSPIPARLSLHLKASP